MESQGTADIRYCESSFNHTKMVIVNLFKYSVFKDITGIDISAAGRQHWRRSLMVYITTVRTSVDAVILDKSRDYSIKQTGLTSVISHGRSSDNTGATESGGRYYLQHDSLLSYTIRDVI